MIASGKGTGEEITSSAFARGKVIALSRASTAQDHTSYELMWETGWAEHATGDNITEPRKGADCEGKNTDTRSKYLVLIIVTSVTK